MTGPIAETSAEAGAMGVSSSAPIGRLAARSAVGGVLMGLANLVPGISGGTMLLAAGVYPDFITGIAEVSTLKFRLRSLVTLAVVAGAAMVSILLFAGAVKQLVVDHRWAMYSLFIGLTLGGVPVLRRLIGRMDRDAWLGAVLGFAGMAGLALVQQLGLGAAGGGAGGAAWMLIAGVAGASAMILPGVSGSYLLLVLGVYVPILAGIDAVKEGLKAADPAMLAGPVVSVVLPVGIGVVVGIVAVSNALRWLLSRYERATLGVLLGLLLGAVVGLYPFQAGVAPELGDIVKGRAVTAERLAELDPEDYPTEFFAPTPSHLGGSLGLIVAGIVVTLGVSRFGGGDSKS